MKKRLLSALLAVASTSALAATYYAAPDGEGDGTSWDNASGDVKALYEAAVSGDEIWLKDGIYELSESILMKSGVTIQGGFLGGETSKAEAKPRENQSILNGMNRSAIYCYSINGVRDTSKKFWDWETETFIPFTPRDEEGVNHFAITKNNSGIKGLSNIFTNGVPGAVTDCEIAGLTFIGTDSAAILTETNATITVNNCQFLGCLGGGVSSEGCITITNSYFRNCPGPIRVSSKELTYTNRLINCEIVDCYAGEASTIDHNSSTPLEMIGCTFKRNTCHTRGGSSISAVVLTQRGTGSYVVIRDCTFEENRVRGDGAAGTSSRAGACQALLQLNSGTTIIERSLFIGNTYLDLNGVGESSSSRHTAGVLVKNNALIKDCSFIGNVVKGYTTASSGNMWAAALILDKGANSVLNCTFKDNVVENISQSESVSSNNVATICRLIRYGNVSDTGVGHAFVNCVFTDNKISGNAKTMGEIVLDTKDANREQYTLTFINTIINCEPDCPSIVSTEIAPNISHCIISDWEGVAYTNGNYFTEFVSSIDPKLSSNLRRTDNLHFRHQGVAARSPVAKCGRPVYLYGTDLYIYAPDMVSKKPWRKIDQKAQNYASFANDASLEVPPPAPDAYGAPREEGKIAYGPLNAPPFGTVISLE